LTGRLDQKFRRIMNSTMASLLRAGTLLAINLLYLMVWGFAGISKLTDGIPTWFEGKFGKTLLAKFPGLTATFWILALAEVLAFGLAVVALARLEFRGKGPATILSATLVWSLFVFLMLGFGQWLTGEFNGAFQQFMYFAATLVALHVVNSSSASQAASVGPSSVPR
jgi:hypothetical protein